MPDVVIRAHGLGKSYRLGSVVAGRDTLRDALSRLGRRMSRSPEGDGTAGGAASSVPFWALRDVSFEVRSGDVLGVIGANGAGKSTLLKILSRITAPTTGYGEIRGRVGSLLEVGTGFHQELSGAENIFLNGAILGMGRREIERKFDEIVAFAEVERFIDTPVKRYSSGMYLRLAFAVAAHLEPEILIVDEVLAVGDAAFQRKCLGKMRSVAGEGRTVVFVSHNMDAVQRLCTRAMLLRNGALTHEGDVQRVVLSYLSSTQDRGSPGDRIELGSLPRSGTGEVRFASARYSSLNAQLDFHPYPFGPLELDLELVAERPLSVESLAVAVRTQGGTRLVEADIITVAKVARLRAGTNHVRFRIDQLYLAPGVYVVSLWTSGALGRPYDAIDTAFEMEVVAAEAGGLGVTPPNSAPVPCRFEFSLGTGPENLTVV